MHHLISCGWALCRDKSCCHVVQEVPDPEIFILVIIKLNDQSA